MIDVSDGLAADLGHICDASGVGLRIDAADVPVSDIARQVARQAAGDPFAWALGGGEDYELAFTAPRDRVAGLIDAVRRVAGTPLHVIGEILPTGEGRTLMLADGSRARLTADGWRHF
jgi:thiamine-monophosphate kinase